MSVSRLVFTVLALLVAPTMAQANARLTQVTPLDGGCVVGPVGSSVQKWDVEAGRTYRVRLEQVTECADGGTAATLDVRVNSSVTGNLDLVAQQVSAGVYTFDVTLPLNASCTLPVFYCTTPGRANTGLNAIRDDGGAFQAHLRIATFGEGCTTPTPYTAGCESVPTRARTWAAVKQVYR